MVSHRLEVRAGAPAGEPMIDNLGIVYIVLNVLWTTVVLAGSAALWYYRRHECIRKRNAGLIIAAVLCLQIYWSLNMIMYPLNGAYPCDLNYWIMSIYFPLGTALYQLQNVQLLSVSARQRDLRRQPFTRSDRLTSRHFQFWKYGSSWNQMTLLSRIYFGISVCVVTQVIFEIASLNTFQSALTVLQSRSSCRSSYSLCRQSLCPLGSPVMPNRVLPVLKAGNGKVQPLITLQKTSLIPAL